MCLGLPQGICGMRGSGAEGFRFTVVCGVFLELSATPSVALCNQKVTPSPLGEERGKLGPQWGTVGSGPPARL